MVLKASVIIPTFEDWPGLQICLDCLAGQTADPSWFEVIVANNNPAPDIPAGLRLPSNARIIHATKPGSYAARNAALVEARGEVLFFTDSDCQPDSRWVENGLAEIARLGAHDRIGGAIEIFSTSDKWTAVELYDRVTYLDQKFFVEKGWCATANLVTRRAVFDLVGPFSEERFAGGDREWGLRASELGSKIALSEETLIRHPARSGFSAIAKKSRRVIGGWHQLELLGKEERLPTASYLSFLSSAEVFRAMGHPGLTEWQRLQVLWVCFRLGVVNFFEVIRLRYLSGSPNRS